MPRMTRVAAIDAGSNAIRLVVADFDETLAETRGCHDPLSAWVRLQLRPLTIPPLNGRWPRSP